MLERYLKIGKQPDSEKYRIDDYVPEITVMLFVGLKPGSVVAGSWIARIPMLGHLGGGLYRGLI